MILQKEQLDKIIKNSSDVLFDALVELLPKYEIDTTNRIAGFLAQTGHESSDYTLLKENLNYSAERLVVVFKKYFPTIEAARPYHRNPEKIANKVYGNRMGNGDESSGEGYKFRGRGAIQLTGKNNYSKFAQSIGKSLDDTVAYCETLKGALESACWFWKTNNINHTCDNDDIVAMTKAINGGTIGIDDRTQRYDSAKEILS
jgi:putative chitinase